MVYNIYTIPVVLLFMINGFGQLYYAYMLKKKYPNEHNFQNSLITFILWMAGGLLYPLFYTRDTIHVRWFQSLAMTIICIYTPLFIFAILFFQYLFITIHDHKKVEARKIEAFLEDFEEFNPKWRTNQETSLITDLHRKMFHFLPAAIIISLWVFAVHIWGYLWGADKIWGITGEEYGIFLILTVGYSAIIIFAALDYVRLSYIFQKRRIYHLLPDTISRLLIKTLRPNEIYEFTKPVVLILALVPSLFLPFGLFASVALIASLGDAAASIMGIKFGKRNFPKNSNKTIIGYISGFFTSLMISIVILYFFEIHLTLFKIFMIALGGALTFLIIDLLNLKIDDNITNPLFCALIMGLLYFFL
ncbi:MAG: hypothetical protein EU539_06075 [Promethearchaeota archaeon]|nr:MAG: hypothetical protein EU539_06075 [Candidatus Lokiarchaeota archaeon]